MLHMVHAGQGLGVSAFADRERQWISDRVVVEDRGYITPCWVWPGWLTPKGYAKVTIPLLGERRVHRAAYTAWVGPIPDGLTIDHLCRVKCCCNPAHLEPVTALENHRRSYPRCRNTDGQFTNMEKARAELSGGAGEGSNAGLDALQLRNAFSSASPLDGGL